MFISGESAENYYKYTSASHGTQSRTSNLATHRKYTHRQEERSHSRLPSSVIVLYLRGQPIEPSPQKTLELEPTRSMPTIGHTYQREISSTLQWVSQDKMLDLHRPSLTKNPPVAYHRHHLDWLHRSFAWITTQRSTTIIIIVRNCCLIYSINSIFFQI
jgi:hypothetical protein